MAFFRSVILSPVALALTLTASLAPAQQRSASEPLLPPAKRSAAPSFTLSDVNGKPVSLAQYRGRVVLLDFWAIACGGCKLELPWYVDFNNKYRQQGLSLIGLDMYGDTPPPSSRSWPNNTWPTP